MKIVKGILILTAIAAGVAFMQTAEYRRMKSAAFSFVADAESWSWKLKEAIGGDDPRWP